MMMGCGHNIGELAAVRNGAHDCLFLFVHMMTLLDV
jgi:hypothetical protein